MLHISAAHKSALDIAMLQHQYLMDHESTITPDFQVFISMTGVQASW